MRQRCINTVTLWARLVQVNRYVIQRGSVIFSQEQTAWGMRRGGGDGWRGFEASGGILGGLEYRKVY